MFVILGCSTEEDISASPETFETWVSHGYGLGLSLAEDGRFAMWELLGEHCRETARGTLSSDEPPTLGIPIEGLTISRTFSVVFDSNEALHLEDAGTYSVAFQPGELPEGCNESYDSNDPELNFELFWQTFDEHYASFGVRDVDWQAAYNTARPQVSANTTDEELLEIMGAMIQPMADDHVSVTAGETVVSSRATPADILENTDAINAKLLEYVTSPETTLTGQELVAYRKLDANTCHLMVFSMIGYSDLTDEDVVAGEMAAASETFDEAMGALSDCSTIIVDMRFNTGGLDAIALDLAGRFADQQRPVYEKSARDGDGTTEPRSFDIVPTGETPFQGDVVVLTSSLTVSAAEIFVLAMKVLPNVVLIGEPTAGAFSDILERKLPNGWSFGLSNETYVAADGTNYEGAGIPVDVAVGLDAAGFADGQDAIFEAALAYLEE